MDIVSKRLWYLLVSALIILPGIISMLVPPAFKAGIEFTSGSVLNLTFAKPVSETEIRTQLAELGHPEAVIQKMGERSVFIRTSVLEEAVRGPNNEVIKPSEREVIEKRLQEKIAPIEAVELDTVSPIVARETVRNAIIALLVASVGIMVYMIWAFRKVPKPLRYGVSSISALIYDMLMVAGIFSILGKTMNMEMNSMFIAGLLTVAGYSINDKIVVFDRIRENVIRNPHTPLPDAVNNSIMETIGRSLNTGMAVIFTGLALLLLGGPTIRGLLLVILIGVVVGTYSSIFIASQFLVIWERGEFRKILRFLRPGLAKGS